MNLYNSFETLPIFNWFELNEKNDLRYLIKGIDYDNLQELSEPENKILLECFERLTDKINNIDNTLQLLFIDCLKTYFAAKENKALETKSNVSFNNYLKKVDIFYKDFTILEKKYSSVQSAYLDYSKKVSWPERFNKRYQIFNLDNLRPKKKSEWNLYEDITLINSVLKININEFDTSVSKFNYFKEKSIKILNEQQKK